MPLRDIAVQSFRERAIRSAVLIDDKFPKYGQAVDGRAGDFPDSARAAELHDGFHRLHIPCDVENHLADDAGVLGLPERLRKCDLVVLDFHLEENNSDKSVRLLRALADSDHFNMVVVYTEDPELHNVWLTIASNLRGGWRAPHDVLRTVLGGRAEADIERALGEWDDRDLEGRLPEVPEELLRAKYGSASADETEAKKRLMSDLVAYDVPGPMRGAFSEALVHRDSSGLRARGDGDDLIRRTSGQCGENGAYWLLCEGLFVSVLKKMDRAVAAVGAETPPRTGDEVGYIYAGLERALRDWNPNPFQVIASEVQNVLEVEALPLDEKALKDDVLHVGMAWDVATSAGEGSYADAADGLLRRLVEAIGAKVRQRLDAGLNVAELLEESVLEAGAGEDGVVVDRMARARRLAHVATEVDEVEVFKRLNCYLCSHPLESRHLTAGSVFRDGDGGYWLCATPACDMVPRGRRRGADRVHPGKMFTAMKLTPVGDVLDVVVSETTRGAKVEQGRYVFVEVDGDVVVLNTVNEHSSQPHMDVFVAKNEGRLNELRGFDAVEIVSSCADPEAYEVGDRSFTVVGRLRDAYADRLLHQAGHHLSRIGVDFRGRGQAE